MKHLFTRLLLFALFALAAPLGLRAQAPDSLHQRLAYLLAPLLADYATPLAPLAAFDGTLTDSTRLNPVSWRALYYQLTTACLRGPSPLPTLPVVNQRVQAAGAGRNTTLPLLVQRIDYAALRPDALTAGLLSYSGGQLHDVPGRPQSPYLLRTLFGVAPSRDVVATGQVSFLFAPALHVQSGGGAVRALAIDFGDGRGFRPATWNVPLAASYAAAGTYRVRVRISYANPGPTPDESFGPAPTTTYYGQFDLRVAAPAAPVARTLAGDTAVFFPAQAGRAAGTAYIHYATNHTTLKKPLIVAEGYDKHFTAPDISEENYSIEQFLKEIRTAKDPS